jgi:kynurenine formamidase
LSAAVSPVRKVLAAVALLAAVGGIAAVALPTASSAQNGTAAGPGALHPISLSHVNDPATTPVFPGDPEFKLTTAFTVKADGYYLQYVQEGEHTGTHWGAPCHFTEGAACADDLTPQDLYLPAVKLDFRSQAAANADYQITVADLQKWERVNGRIPTGAAVVAYFGWGSKWGTAAYANEDKAGGLHQPGFSLAAANWLIKNRLGIRGALGSDTFGPDPGTDDTYAISAATLQQRRLTLENLTNLGALPTTGAYILIGGPINKNGSGSTATIWALTT